MDDGKLTGGEVHSSFNPVPICLNMYHISLCSIYVDIEGEMSFTAYKM